MLRKLIKYDFINTWKQYTLILGLSVVAAVVGALASAIASFSEDTLQILSALAGFCMIGAFVAPMAIWILVAIHYHKKFFSDEAYLTFTLPATPAQHLTAKMISGVTWYFASAGVMIFNFLIIIFTEAIVYATKMSPEMIPDDTAPIVMTTMDWLTTLSWGVCIVIAMVAQLALLYLSLTLSGNIATKHKGLVGVVVYMAVNSVASTVMSIAEGVLMFTSFSVEGMEFMVLGILSSVLYAGMCAACLSITHHILSRKLNIQ